MCDDGVGCSGDGRRGRVELGQVGSELQLSQVGRVEKRISLVLQIVTQ